MMSNGDPLDLYKLFMVVKEKGGYDAVCKNKLWDLVGEEYGLVRGNAVYFTKDTIFMML